MVCLFLPVKGENSQESQVHVAGHGLDLSSVFKVQGALLGDKLFNCLKARGDKKTHLIGGRHT